MSVLITPKMECIFSGSTWSDIFSDVSQPIECGYGISGLGPLDLIASTGSLSFALRNAEVSSASPYLANPQLLSNRGFEGATLGSTLTTNYCLNPSFEVNITDDWTWVATGTPARTTAKYKVGTAALQITCGAAFGYLTSNTGVSVPNGATVSISGWVQADSTPTGAKLVLLMRDTTNNANRVVLSGTAAAEDAWEYVSGSWTNTTGLAATCKAWCYVAFNDSSTICYFDAIQLELAAAATPYCDGTLGWNYAWTGTAHNSTSTRKASVWPYWTASPGSGATDNEISSVHSGIYAAKLISGSSLNTAVSQAAVVIPGASYGFQFEARGDGTYPGRFRIYDVSNGADIVAATSTGITGASYIEVAGTFVAPAGCTSARIDLMCPSTQHGVSYFDDVSCQRQISGGQIGRYTPGHANSRAGWDLGSKVRLSFAYSGSTFYKTVGYATSITPTAGLHKERRVDVSAVDWLDFAGTQKVRQLQIQSNVTTGCALQLLLAQAVTQPRATCVMTSQETYDRVFDSDNDSKTTIAAGIAKLMRNELGQAYLRGDSSGGETLEMMGRYGRVAGGLTGVAASLTSTMTELEIEYDRSNIWNTVRGRTYPKAIDTSACTCVFTLQSPIGVAASQTQTFTAHYRDVYSAKAISASAIVYPFRATVDYNFGSASGTGGGDKNSSACFSASIGSNSARIEVENNSATTGYLNDFKLYGKGIYYFDPVEYEVKDDVSVSAYGERALDLELEYQTSQTRGEPLAQYLLDLWSEPRRLIKSVRFLANRSDEAALAAMRCEPGSRVYINEPMTATDGYYDINSVQYEIVSAQEMWVTWGVVAADTTGYFRLDHSLLDIDVIAP